MHVHSGGPVFVHRQLTVNGVSVHVATAGSPGKQPVFLMHGFPQDWSSFGAVMLALKDDFYVIAPDLPGIGASAPIGSTDKKDIAAHIHGILTAMQVEKAVMVGHDVGGMILYPFLKMYPGMLSRAVIMNVAIPGVEPWTRIKQNPMIWHFTFHKISGLPETLITGREKAYFDYYFDTITKNPAAITEEARFRYAGSYAAASALKTGLGWYRSFGQDEKDNLALKEVALDMPVLYLRGDAEYGHMDEYLAGFRDSGILQVEGATIANSGHYAPEEAPGAVAGLLRNFIRP